MWQTCRKRKHPLNPVTLDCWSSTSEFLKLWYTFPTSLVSSLYVSYMFKIYARMRQVSLVHSICGCCTLYCTLFLCSSAKQMPASVGDALKEVFQQEGGLSAEEAEQMFMAMEKTGRLQSETWS